MKNNKYAGYKLQGLDFIDRAFKQDPNQQVTEIAKNVADELDIEYNDSFRRTVSHWVGVYKDKKIREKSFDVVKYQKDGFELNLPDGDQEIDIESVTLPTRLNRIGVLSDIHFPYHDRDALATALKYIKDFGANTIILNGDIVDCYQLSSFAKDPLARSFKYEIDLVKAFFAELRRIFGDIEILYSIGNHEVRFERFMMDKASELKGLIDIEDIFGFNEYRIKHVPSEAFIKAGNLNILHGHETKVGGSINHARNTMIKTGVSTLFGHFHRTQESLSKNLNGKVYGAYATGCMCKLKPKYMPINGWNHGFATVELEKGGNFEVDNRKMFL